METEIKSKTRTEHILTAMQFLAWIAFFGYMIEAGSILISFIVSYFNPEAASNLYKGLDFYTLRQLNIWYYACYVSFMIVISVMKAVVGYLAINILSKINLNNPFKMEVVRILERISYMLFAISIVGMSSSEYIEWLNKVTGESFQKWSAGEFVLISGLVYIISQIFRRGVEIQSENDLTV